MTEKNEAEDGNSISLKSPWHMTDSNSYHFFLLPKLGEIYIFYTSLIHRKVDADCRETPCTWTRSWMLIKLMAYMSGEVCGNMNDEIQTSSKSWN